MQLVDASNRELMDIPGEGYILERLGGTWYDLTGVAPVDNVAEYETVYLLQGRWK